MTVASLFDAVENYLAAGQRVQELCQQAGLARTPHEIMVITYLGKHQGGAAPEVAMGAGINIETVRSILRRLSEEQKPLIRYPNGRPKAGRPPDGGAHTGRAVLTPAGLRLYDQIRKPVS